MRLRTFLLLLVVLLVAALGVTVVVLGLNGTGPAASLLGPSPTEVPIVADGDSAAADGTSAAGPTATPAPTPTPQMRFVPIVVASADIPAGTLLRSDLLRTELRPETNIAVVQQYAFTELRDVVGKISTVSIALGQEILGDMLTESPADVRSFGSDLALFVPEGYVAVPLPIDLFSGLAYSMRPGDRVDVMMTLAMVEVDPEFQSILPNTVQEVNQVGLQEGESFLLPPIPLGRLELVPLVNQVAYIGPREPLQVLRPVTQMMVQQAEVMWLGTWVDNKQSSRLLDLNRVRLEAAPDVVILSMPLQDALTLKWALEVGLNINLALRAQGDGSPIVTTSVSLPQMVEQSGVTIPEQNEFRLEPNILNVPPPSLPDKALPPSLAPPTNPGPASDGDDGTTGGDTDAGGTDASGTDAGETDAGDTTDGG